ncbi:MAG: DUF1015 domain-containing protein [Candidatus Dormibacteria bacterium]
MADVRPLRGVTYDGDRVELGDVLCPPYDVISPAQQAAYYAREPHNAVRIVLNSAEGDARYSAAAAALREWLGDGVLRRAEAPAFFVHRHSFQVPGRDDTSRISRVGVMAAVRLQPWTDGAVKPHEHTMPGPKEDRLRLMRATAADTEPIWCFHPDDDGAVGQVLNAITAEAPGIAVTFQPVPGVDESAPAEVHELWEVSHPATIARLGNALAAVQLYIADGHHRYETALHHARELGGGLDDATSFKLMLLSSAADPGLLVLPTHRLARFAPNHSLAEMMRRLEERGWRTDAVGDLATLEARLLEPTAPALLGVGIFAGGRFTYVEGTVESAATAALAPSLANLDVAVLQEEILGPLCGIGQAELADAELIAYSRDSKEVVARVTAGEFDLGVFVRPPTLAQVQAVADAGENMPQKSTYFWPKPASGLLMMLQPPGEPL